jgi:5-methylcytosine-specific restriction protein A
MPTMPKTHRALGQPTAAARAGDDYRRRGTRQSQGYTNEWLARARDFRKRYPLCAMHLRLGKVRPAECVDHIIPHRGDQGLFWDEGNWQSLCNHCHNGEKRREEIAARRLARDRVPTCGGLPAGRGSLTGGPPVPEARLGRIFALAKVDRGGF